MSNLVRPFVALALLIASATVVSASPFTFTIVTKQTQFSLGLELDETPITTAQTPGSDTTSLSGTLNLDVTPTSLRFLATGNIQFALQPLSQAPLAGGAMGTSPAQYGLNVLISGLASGVVSARNYVGDMTSGDIARVGTSFDASQVTANLVTGNTAYNLTILGSPVTGSFNSNNPAPNMLSGGILTSDGSFYTLTLPVLVKGPVTVSGVTVMDVYSGTIVAVAPVPEPRSIALAMIGLVALAWRGYPVARRRHKRTTASSALS